MIGEGRTDMEVRLIDCTGNGNPDPHYAARLLVYTKNTRLEQGLETRAKIAAMSEEELTKELAYIATTIRSSWEFIDYTFEIRGVSRAFTHQLVRTRTASYAQQSQRSVNMEDFETVIPDNVRNSEVQSQLWDFCSAVINQTYKKMIEQGLSAQDARGLLPTNIKTNIIMKANLRTIADMIPKRKNLRAQDEYQAFAGMIEDCVLGVHPWAKPFLSPERLSTPSLDAMLKKALGTASPVDAPEINKALKELDALKGTWG